MKDLVFGFWLGLAMFTVVRVKDLVDGSFGFAL